MRAALFGHVNGAKSLGSDESPVLVISGPTAVGKSALSLAFAEALGCEVVSMDSMAVYRRMDIGTAKPSADERARVPHHLLDVAEPNEEFDTHRFCTLADGAVEEIRARGHRPLFVGGTTLYLMAFFKGMVEGAAADPALRRELGAREDAEPGWLLAELQRVDPEAAARIHRNDRRRLTRALEVFRTTGRPISAQQTTFDSDAWRVPCRIVALTRPRDVLHERVRIRTRAMLDAGLLDEVRTIRDEIGFSKQASAGIGYRECLDHLVGRYKDLEELRNRIRRSTHRLVRRQTTWLRHLRDQVRWLDADATLDELAEALTADRSS